MARCILKTPRTFEGKRLVQLLRWIATVVIEHIDLKKNGKKTEEVQAALYEGQFIISTNTNSDNNLLSELIRTDANKQQTCAQYLQLALEEIEKNRLQNNKRPLARHKKKLSALLRLEEFIKEPFPFTQPFIIPKNVKNGKSHTEEGLHAERRIARHIQGPSWYEDGNYSGTPIAGVKRPCTTCFHKLFRKSPDQEKYYPHPGPVWKSKASMMSITEEDRQQIEGGAHLTAVTSTQTGIMTIDCGSESDSEFCEKDYGKRLKEDTDYQNYSRNIQVSLENLRLD